MSESEIEHFIKNMYVSKKVPKKMQPERRKSIPKSAESAAEQTKVMFADFNKNPKKNDQKSEVEKWKVQAGQIAAS